MSDSTAVPVSHAAAANKPDSRPAIVRAVENWNRVLGSGGPPVPRRPLVPAPDADRGRIDAAARRASGVYPGPAGELIRRELLAALELGHRFEVGHRGALMLRLAEQVLTATPRR